MIIHRHESTFFQARVRFLPRTHNIYIRCCCPADVAPAADAVILGSTQKQLILDNHTIEEMSGLARRFHALLRLTEIWLWNGRVCRGISLNRCDSNSRFKTRGYSPLVRMTPKLPKCNLPEMLRPSR